MKIKTYMDVRFDVTDLTPDERGALALEVAVQAEESDFVGNDEHGWQGHRGVPEPEIEWNEVEVEEGPTYAWFGWDEGEEIDPPEPGKRWLTITEDGEEIAVIVHRMTSRFSPEEHAQLMTAKVHHAQRIVEALQQTADGYTAQPEGYWFVGKIGEGISQKFDTKAEAEAAIAGISLIDPEGVAQGMYFLDPPSDDDEGPGESSIYSSELP